MKTKPGAKVPAVAGSAQAQQVPSSSAASEEEEDYDIVPESHRAVVGYGLKLMLLEGYKNKIFAHNFTKKMLMERQEKPLLFSTYIKHYDACSKCSWINTKYSAYMPADPEKPTLKEAYNFVQALKAAKEAEEAQEAEHETKEAALRLDMNSKEYADMTEFMLVTYNISNDRYTTTDLYTICPYIPTNEYYELLVNLATKSSAIDKEALTDMLVKVRAEYCSKHKLHYMR